MTTRADARAAPLARYTATAVVLHWNGSVWTSVPSGTSNDLYAVWGSGPSAAWAMGDGGTILRWTPQ